MRAYTEEDYNPEYGLLVLRDPDGGSDDGSDDGEPSGTLAGAGDGWLTAQSGSGYHLVRLELHDAEPPADGAGFDDVLETPYRGGSGGLELTMLTGGSGGEPDFELAGPGHHRVRIARRLGGAASNETAASNKTAASNRTAASDGTAATDDGGGTPDGDLWLLRFWPVEEPGLPRWLVRSRPAVGPGDNGWRGELHYQPMEFADIVHATAVEHGGAVTVEQVDAWVQAHMRPAGWLDEPFWPPPRTPLTTGHADLDRRNAAQHAEVVAGLAGRQRRLDEIAAELGVAPVRRRRDALPLLAAAGVLTREGSDRYRTGRPARVDTVLSLPPGRARAVRLQDARSRYQGLADDVVAVLRWAGSPLAITPAELAGLLLVTEAEARDTLAYAERTGMLHADADPSRLWAGRRATPPRTAGQPATPPRTAGQPATPPGAAPRPASPRAAHHTRPPAKPSGKPEPGPSIRVGAMVRFTVNRATTGDATDDHTTTGNPTDDPAATRRFATGFKTGPEPASPPGPPFGAPPRAGVLTGDGALIVWRDGVPVELAHLEPARRGSRALQTAHGVLVVGHHAATLIAADGGRQDLDRVRGGAVTVLPGGRRLVVVGTEHHRRQPRYEVRVVDLAGGPEVSMPWPAEEFAGVVGVHRETVYVNDARGATTTWTIGSEPVRHPYPVDQIDPLSGTTAGRRRGGVAVFRPDGTEITVPVELTARLAPGGAGLWTVRSHPPAFTLFPIGSEDVEPRVWWLPTEGRVAVHGNFQPPVFEDRDHVIFGHHPWAFPQEPTSGLRLDLRDGSVWRLPAADGRPGRSVTVVEPLLPAEP